MKIFLASMLLLQCLLNESGANINGQTNARIPLLKEDSTATGTTITCSPYSVVDDTEDVEYVKYVLDTEEEASSTVTWNPQTSKTLFEDCASYAAEQNAGMFYFDGDTCETSDTVYERKEKTCNSVAAKMVYMQKGLQPEVCTEGDEWDDIQLPCGVSGRKRCVNSIIISERVYGPGEHTSHMEGVDYFPTTNGCFLKPLSHSKGIAPSDQTAKCSEIGAVPCDPPSGVDGNTFIESTIEMLESPEVSSMPYFSLVINAHKNSSNQYNWNGNPSTPAHFLSSRTSAAYAPAHSRQVPISVATSAPAPKNCLAIYGQPVRSANPISCDNKSNAKLCCMLKE